MKRYGNGFVEFARLLQSPHRPLGSLECGKGSGSAARVTVIAPRRDVEGGTVETMSHECHHQKSRQVEFLHLRPRSRIHDGRWHISQLDRLIFEPGS